MSAGHNPIQSYLARNARAFPDKPFIESIDQEKSATYGQFNRLTNQFAQLLKSRNVRPNERIVLLSGNSIEHLVAFLGVMKYGATICTINVDTNRLYLTEILAAVRARLVLFEQDLGIEGIAEGRYGEAMLLGEWRPGSSSGLFATLEGLPETPVDPVNSDQDDVLIVYTSGTTSRPKGSISIYRQLMTNGESVADALGLGPDDRLLEFRSLNWLSAQGAAGLAPLFRGATLILARKFSESGYFEWLKTYRATIGIGNPTCIAMLLNRPIDIKATELPHLRFITSSSAPLPLEHWKAFEEMYGVPVAQGYGATEALWIALSNERTRRIGSVGRPFPSQNLKIVNEEGKPLPAGTIGQVEVGGDPELRYRYQGYDGQVETTAVGRMRPGDLGYLDADGYLFLTGRTRDLIIRGGVNISPVEVQNILLQVPGVAEAAAIGVPDRIYGEEVVAYVACKAGAHLTQESVLAQCQGKLPPAKLPKQILFKEELPKGDRGKIDRKLLAEEWQREHSVA